MDKVLAVLLIEDDLVDQKAFANTVVQEQLLYSFEIASSVAEARLALTTRTYDVILTDFKLLDGDAFDLIDDLLGKLVIFMTGSGDEEIAVQAMRLGICDYLVKDPERHYLKLLPHRIAIARRQWHAEQDLRESEDRLRDFVQNANDMIQNIAMDGRIQFVNRAWLSTLGYTEAELTQLTIYDIIHPDYRDECQGLFRRISRGESIGRIQTVFQSKDHRDITVEGSINCRFENGLPVTTRGIFHDITERNRREEERERLIKELRAALAEVKTLSGLLPVCAWCKKIRDDKGYWQNVQDYLDQNVQMTHGICPDCRHQVMPELPDPKSSE